MWQLDWNKLAEVLTYNAKQPMIFSSGLFLFLFLGFSLIYVLLQKKDTARILFVSLFSYYFYYKSSGFYFFLLGVVTVTDFFLAGRMAVTESKWGRKGLLLLSLFVNLGLLSIFFIIIMTILVLKLVEFCDISSIVVFNFIPVIFV